MAQFQEGQKRGLLASHIDFSVCMMVVLRLLGRGYRCPALGVVPASSEQRAGSPGREDKGRHSPGAAVTC